MKGDIKTYFDPMLIGLYYISLYFHSKQSTVLTLSAEQKIYTRKDINFQNHIFLFKKEKSKITLA